MAKKNIVLNGKSLLLILLIGLIAVSAFGFYKYQEYEEIISSLEYENDDLTEKIEDLKNKNEEIKDELNNASFDMRQHQNCQFYKDNYAENRITLSSVIEYGLLKKYSLTQFIVPEEQYNTYELGQLKVKYKVNSYKEYAEILEAQAKDIKMKYVLLLNKAYSGDGIKHYYDYNPYQ